VFSLLRFGSFSSLRPLVLAYDAGGPPLDDSFWHVTDYYKNIRDKVKKLDGDCHKINDRLPSRICNIGMQVRPTMHDCFRLLLEQ
jgi:hypothetical protein